MKPRRSVAALVVIWAALGGAILTAKDLRPERGARIGQAEVTRAGAEETTTLIAIGDSLTHGTMDAANNSLNTEHAYMQLVAEALGEVLPLQFEQPLFDEDENRISPRTIPTNLAVDGADSFSVEGIEYYKRVGADESYVEPEYLCDARLPRGLDSTTDKVLYPINRRAGIPVSQIDAAIWHLDEIAAAAAGRAALVVWVGNNDSSAAALGGGDSPTMLPLPFEQIREVVTPQLRFLMRFATRLGIVSFEPYSMESIERGLTGAEEFAEQYEHLLSRMESESLLPPERLDLFLLTLPYYSAIGFLMDSEDLEYYLQQVDPAYSVPPSFARVAAPGAPITNPLAGDRVSLLTFGMMYTMLVTGHSVAEVNAALETAGVQNDGLVLSQAEQQFVMARIDEFNAAIAASAAARGDRATLVPIGEYLNAGLSGQLSVEVGGRVIGRKWVRGNGFSLDGVHPGYTGHALIANFVLEAMNGALGVNAPLYDLEAIAAGDPYLDLDSDGWAPGPDYKAVGMTDLLFMLRDPDDGNAAVRADLPDDVWDRISTALINEVIDIPEIRREAGRVGIVAAK